MAKTPVLESLSDLVRPHIDSYDFFLGEGLLRVQESLQSVEVEHPTCGQRLTAWLEDIRVGKPFMDDTRPREAVTELRVFPRECRQAGTSYTAPLTARLCWRFDDNDAVGKDVRLSNFPVMVRSSACNLYGLSQQELVERGEEANELGGYFIVNGIERLLRLLINQRRHYIMGMVRGAYARRGPTFSEYATAIRCVAPDETSMTVRVHYLTNGGARLAFVLRRQEFFIPVALVLRSLIECSDKEVFDKVIASTDSIASFAAERVEVMLQETARLGLHTRAQCLAHLGRHFRPVLDAPASRSDNDVGEQLLRELVFVHLTSRHDKFNLLVLMLRKLYALASGSCKGDNPDSMLHQEALLPGHLIQQFVKERLVDLQSRLKEILLREATDKAGVRFDDPGLVERSFVKASSYVDIGKRMEYLLATGNLVSKSGMGLSQTSGFTIVAEKLNFLRYLSHFRSIHRGAYFQELRTTTVRKLLPDSWGFLCPVHTPDGSPCGLLNHLAASCSIVVDAPDALETRKSVSVLLAANGMLPASPSLATPLPPLYLPVMLDGAVIGSVRAAAAPRLVTVLRLCKVNAASDVPPTLEAALVPFTDGGPYPGLYLFSSPARFSRPVLQLGSAKLMDGAVEFIGSLEQAFMDIRCPDGGDGGSKGFLPSHEETGPTAFLSAVASLTPWSDFNQSPRNMYQCQMAKQTMGTPLDSYIYRADTKLYRIHTPQKPVARTQGYNRYQVDQYPLGTNAVVAVLAHTGYDMEDAMIINKSSLDRGFAHGTLVKTETIDVSAGSRGARLSFGRGLASARDKGHDDSGLGSDGLPVPGMRVTKGSSLYSVVDENTGTEKITRHKHDDSATISQVTIVGMGPRGSIQKVNLQMLYNRNPVTGDKFSSRHGQKGVLSFGWPDENMPFVGSTGMRPDIIINPHAFPSRMTIGMLVESIAAKSACLDGRFVDATPFKSSTDASEPGPVETFGDVLGAHGFSRLGGESMICGTSGVEFQVDIFIGVVYYQRLRHMVSDKFQVRSVGPINAQTRQPVKGRKAGGGIRVGEMERDALLGHGAAFLLQDRLHACSDRAIMAVCTVCGSLLAVSASSGCAACGGSKKVASRVALPYVLHLLCSELAAMGISLKVAVA